MKVKEIVNELASMHREYKDRYDSDNNSLTTLVDEDNLQNSLMVSFDHQNPIWCTVRLEATRLKFWESNKDEISIKLTSNIIVERCKNQTKFVILYVDILGHPRQVTIEDPDLKELQMWYYSVKSNCVSNPSVPRSPRSPRSPLSPAVRLPLRSASLSVASQGPNRQASFERHLGTIDRRASKSMDRYGSKSMDRYIQRSW